MSIERKKDLEDYLEAVESQLNLLDSTPLTEGGTFPWPKKMVDEQLFLQSQKDFVEDELEILDEDECADAKNVFKEISPKRMRAIIPKGQENSDRTYVLDLCDEFLDEVSFRQFPYRYVVNYEWITVKVDAYYMVRNIVIEYQSGTRRKALPNDGVTVIELSYKDFGTSKKLKRDRVNDKKVIAQFLVGYRKIKS